MLIYTCVCTCMHLYVKVCLSVNVLIGCMHACMHLTLYGFTCMHMYVVSECACMNTCVHTVHLSMNMYTYMYIHVHPHTGIDDAKGALMQEHNYFSNYPMGNPYIRRYLSFMQEFVSGSALRQLVIKTMCMNMQVPNILHMQYFLISQLPLQQPTTLQPYFSFRCNKYCLMKETSMDCGGNFIKDKRN